MIRKSLNNIEIIKPGAVINAATPEIALHVSLYINGDGRPAWLIKMAPQGPDPKALMLEIMYKHEAAWINNPQQIKYKEKLSSADRYEKIEIWYNGDKIEEIGKIEVIK